jgi:AMP nucleosidase
MFDLTKDFPLALFDGLRTDYSLARLRHYTGTPVESCQSWILFTNYHRYVDEFVRWACAQLADPDTPMRPWCAPAG